MEQAEGIESQTESGQRQQPAAEPEGAPPTTRPAASMTAGRDKGQGRSEEDAMEQAAGLERQTASDQRQQPAATARPAGDRAAAEQRARALEREAKAARGDEARQRWTAASEHWWRCLQAAPEHGWALARYLTCGRKAGFDPEALLQSAPEAIARLGENRWVLAALGWVWRTLARDRAERGDGPGALSAVFRALRSARQGRDPGVLLACLAADLNRALDVLRQPRNPDRTMGLQELARLLRENSALFLEHLPAEPDGRGPARSAALERFGYLCRRVGESTADEALIEATMQPLAERYPDNPWFAAARVRAAVWRNALDEARQRGRDAAERLADHWALAAARAEAERAAQNPERADKILTRACLGATQPWPWRALAKLALERDQPERAARLLACALAFHDREDPGKVWRLHLRRAQALDAIGDAEAAARETWLAAEARRRAGWNEGRELEAWCADRRAAWRPILDQLDAAPAGQVRRRALAGYREQLTATRREHARPAAVTRYDPERGFGFAQLEDGRQAFLHRSVVRDRTVTAGQRLQVVLVRSFDRKKERLGWKVAWFEPAGAGQEGPAAVA